MSTSRNEKVKTRPGGKSSMARIEGACEHVFWATGIVDCCVYALESRLLPKNGRPDIQGALEGAHALLAKASGKLADVLDGEKRSEGDEP